MKTLPFLLCCLTFLAGCSKLQRIDQLPAIRLVEEPDGYRHEIGTYTKSGFVPTHVSHGRFSDISFTPDEVRQLNGKAIIPLGNWAILEKYHDFQREKQTVELDHVPYVILK